MPMKPRAVLPYTILALAGAIPCLAEQTIELSKLDLSLMTTGWGKAQADKAVTEKPLRIGQQDFAKGVGTHAESEFFITLGGTAERFTAQVGVDAAAGDKRATVEFVVYGDGKELWKSGVCKAGNAPKPCDVPLKGVQTLLLTVAGGKDGIGWDHADWADARITYNGDTPKAFALPIEEAFILTPPAPAAARINGPKIYGVRPGSPFLYRIPATGTRPMIFSAEGLPEGLKLDPDTGIISGKTATRGEYKGTLKARNGEGESTRPFRIVVGDKLSLVPYMGWNHWYTFYHDVSDMTVRTAADALLSSGMADYGYDYVNLDDCWMVKVGSKDPQIGGPTRNPDGSIKPNKNFPDMKALTDYIHAKGLKAGLYTSPGPQTCAGYEGSYQHEAQDARTFAEWGFDFLKYDWCSYRSVAGGKAHENYVKPYQLMWDELQKLDRDIVFNLCQYGMNDVWKWGGEVGHSWRTTGDLGLAGGSLSKGIYQVGLRNATLAEYAGPGRWNDPDYLLLGYTNDAHRKSSKAAPLTPSEGYTQMSLWCLMASPLIYGGDMTKLDPLTLGILCNREVIDVDIDPLGRQARIIEQTPTVLILAKDMEDGSKAVGLFNLGPMAQEISANWSALGLTGRQRVRDLWRQKDLDDSAGPFKTTIPRHGVVLIQLWPKK
jgi:alpha-galactosidase